MARDREPGPLEVAFVCSLLLAVVCFAAQVVDCRVERTNPDRLERERIERGR